MVVAVGVAVGIVPVGVFVGVAVGIVPVGVFVGVAVGIVPVGVFVGVSVSVGVGVSGVLVAVGVSVVPVGVGVSGVTVGLGKVATVVGVAVGVAGVSVTVGLGTVGTVGAVVLVGVGEPTVYRLAALTACVCSPVKPNQVSVEKSTSRTTMLARLLALRRSGTSPLVVKFTLTLSFFFCIWRLFLQDSLKKT